MPNNKISGGRELKACFPAKARLALFVAVFVPASENRRESSPAHKLALLVYRMLKGGVDYTDIGQEQYDNQFKKRALKSLARKAIELGLQLVPCPENEVP